MNKLKKLIIIGDSAFAQVAYEYFSYDSEYAVIAFAVEKAYLTRTELFDLPVVAFEEIADLYPQDDHFFFVATVYTKLNRLRTRLYEAMKSKGYKPASYISRNAFVWRNAIIGEHCFIFENNVIQPFVTIGNNVILWSGNHIGHHSTIKDNCFIASHAVISGFVTIGKNCFIGVNATVANNVSIGDDCILGAGALVSKDIEEDKVIKSEPGEPAGSARRLNRVRGTV